MSATIAATPAIPIWHCDLKPLSGDKLDNLTVGVKFEMECRGDIAVHWNGTPKVVFSEKTPPGVLTILEVRKLDPTTADFIVTSYRAGPLKPEYIRVMTGSDGFEASGLEWNVQSVLKQGQPPQPFGPFGPFALPLPTWIWLAVGLIVATLASALWLWFQNFRYRRRLRAALAEFAKAGVNPSAQFHRDIRHLSRRVLQSPNTAGVDEWIQIVDSAVRVYLLREYHYLTVKVPRSALFAGLRRGNPDAFEGSSVGLTKLYSELDRFRAHANQHKPAEFDQILKIAQNWCDGIEKEKARRA